MIKMKYLIAAVCMLTLNAYADGFVDDTKWNGLTSDIKIDGYVRLDLRISKKLLNNKLEISFVGQNLTDKLHPETTDGMATYEVEQLLYGQITLRFD